MPSPYKIEVETPDGTLRAISAETFISSVPSTGAAYGTITASNPFTISQTWNNAGVTFVGNSNDFTDTASNAASVLERWRVGGADRLSIAKTGQLTFGPPVSGVPNEVMRINRPTAYTGAIPYTVRIYDTAQNSATSYNSPVVSGFNAYGVDDSAQAGIYYSLEPDYRPGPADRYKEAHLEVYHPSGGATSRLYSATFVQGATMAASTNTWDFRGNTFAIYSLTGGTAYFSVSGSSLNYVAADGASGWRFVAASGAPETNLQPSVAGTTHVLRLSTWQHVAAPTHFAANTAWLGTPDAFASNDALVVDATGGVVNVASMKYASSPYPSVTFSATSFVFKTKVDAAWPDNVSYAGYGTARLTISDSGLDIPEITAPAAPAANIARLYCVDNGAGKTQLAVRFPTGAVQVLATEP